MKKKLVILGLSSVLAVSAVAVSAIAISKKAKSNDTLKATDPEYMLVIDSPIYEGSDPEGSGLDYKVVKTALGNDVKLAYDALYEYEPGYGHVYDTGVNCLKNGSYFAIVANEEGNGVAGISSISITTDNDTYGGSQLVAEYGWDDGVYLLSEKKPTSDGDQTYNFVFGDYHPTFVKFSVTDSDSRNRVGIHEIVIEYECSNYSNPFYIDGDYGFKVYGDHATVSLYTGTSVDLVIPAMADGQPVTYVDDDFNCVNIGKDTIKTVALPSSVRTIGDSAFYGASKLESINLDDVTYIGSYAFYYCEKLGDVNLSNVEYVQNYAFVHCVSMTDIGSFDSLISIEYSGFYYCTSLTGDLVFPATTTKIGGSAFMYDDITSVTIDDAAVVYVGDAAFRNCSELVSVYLGDNVYRSDDLLYNDKLETITVGENNENYVAVDNVLYYINSSNSWTGVRMAPKRAETTYVMPEKVTSLYGYFAYATQTLESITFNDRITNTADYSFNNCENLTSITFGSSITNISASFVGCNALVSVHIPGTVSHIEQRAFNGCEALETVIIDDGVTRLDKEAFAYCTALTTAVIPSTLTSAGDKYGWDAPTADVFEGCTSLTNVFTRLTSGSYVTSDEGPIFTGFYGSRTLNNYSETYAAGYWHFDVFGNPVLW